MTNDEKILILKEKLKQFSNNMNDQTKLKYLKTMCEYRLRRIIQKCNNIAS